MISIVPFIFWLCMKYVSGLKVQLVEVICTFGYGISPWCICLLLTIFGVDWFRWVVGLCGFGLTTVFFLRNYYPLFASTENAANQQNASRGRQLSTGTIILLAMIASWLGFFFAFVFLFTNSDPTKWKKN
jgi:hypothetical protein